MIASLFARPLTRAGLAALALILIVVVTRL